MSPAEPTDRRRFVLGALGVASLLGVPRLPQRVAAPRRWNWPLDLDGDSLISQTYRALLSGLQNSSHGSRLHPRDGWDPRLDFLSRGHVGADQLQRYDAVRPVPRHAAIDDLSGGEATLVELSLEQSRVGVVEIVYTAGVDIWDFLSGYSR